MPDLLSTDADGAVTLWDVRNPRRLVEKFTLQSDRTRSIPAAAAGHGVVLDDLFALDDGSGRTKSSVWHLAWNETLRVDLESKLNERT
ncbi:hypothetical protein [Rhodococcus oryzae]|uniref:hypothetical protein n=1 Tax=Rhodococcus oryzae TaxID=2571143 RepID=UPI0037B4910E